MPPVVRSAAAEQDLEEIIDYLEEHSPSSATSLADAIASRCEMLGQLPEMGRSREDLAPGLRSIVVRPYTVFYRVTKKAVVIVRILHGRRDVDRIMSEHEDTQEDSREP